MNKSLKNISLNWGNIPKICEYFPTLEKPTKFGKCSQKLGKYSQIWKNYR